MHLLVIAGPTATGKTALAVEVAHRLGTEIISADSRQVYRGLDLGTGKDLLEYQKYQPHVPYHLIDIVDPKETYSLYNYQQDCYRIIAERANVQGPVSQVMVMAGGTGMYMEAILRRYRIANVTENLAVRNRFTGWTREDLEAELHRQDPELAARTDLSSGKRIIRALEISKAGETGSIEYSSDPIHKFSFSVFVTRMERFELRSRIDARVAARLRDGMVEEVAELLKKGVTPARMAVLGMEYRAISDYLAEGKSLASMTENLCHQIHMLAKRQETYFRGMERRGVPISWLEPHPKAETILNEWKRISKDTTGNHV